MSRVRRKLKWRSKWRRLWIRESELSWKRVPGVGKNIRLSCADFAVRRQRVNFHRHARIAGSIVSAGFAGDAKSPRHFGVGGALKRTRELSLPSSFAGGESDGRILRRQAIGESESIRPPHRRRRHQQSGRGERTNLGRRYFHPRKLRRAEMRALQGMLFFIAPATAPAGPTL